MTKLVKLFSVVKQIGNFFLDIIGILLFFGIFFAVPFFFVSSTGLWKPLQNPSVICVIAVVCFGCVVLKMLEKQNSMIETVVKNQREMKLALDKDGFR